MSGSEKLMTPIFLKTADDMELPTNEPAYLLISGNGIWMCRNHELFQSSTPARSWPCELANHRASLTLNHPKIPQEMLEQIVGFFSEVAERHSAEAGVILVWDKKQQRMDMIVPRQLATVNETWNGKIYPIGVHYELPTNLDKDVIIIADVHSHVYDAAYSSYQDRSDEEYRAGLHLVVGRLDCEPPQFHAEFVVDGIRFDVDLGAVIEGYQSRCKQVPQDWLKLVSVKTLGPGYSTSSGYNDFSKSPLPSPGHYRDDTKSSRWPDES
jgi:PRTRC genetic system protein A